MPQVSLSSAEVLVPSRAYVYIAPTGTTAPADSNEALDPAWVNVGHTTPDSLSISTEPEFEEVPSHQSDYPVRRMQTSESASVSVDLIQWNTNNLIAAFGGGTVTEPDNAGNPGEFKFVPPSVGSRSEKSAVVEVIDGTKHYRWVFPRVMQIEGVESELQKGQEARLPLRLAVLGDDSGEPWYLLTDDPAMAPLA